MQTTITKKASSLIAALMLMLAPLAISDTYAAFGNLASTTVTLGGSTVSGATGTSSFAFTTTNAIPAGGSIQITIPSAFTAGDIANAADTEITTFTVGGTNKVADVASAVLTSKILTITTQTESLNGAFIVTFDNTVVDTNPSFAGQYAFQITTKNASGVVLDTGYALAGIGNTVALTATVAEALLLTLDATALNLNVDPSVNNGEDYSQKTVLTVATNAVSGYKIQAKLDDGTGAANLKNATTGDTITSGDAEGTENRFGYVGYNGDGAASPDITATTTRTQAEIKSDASAVSTFSNATASLTNVPATAANAAPTAAGLGRATPANVSKHTVYYALNVDYTKPAGAYTGTITYTALPTF